MQLSHVTVTSSGRGPGFEPGDVDLIVLTHLAATWLMVGLIWTIQVVHYPLFPSVGADAFPANAAGHSRRVSRLLAIPAVLEVASAVALILVRPPEVSPALLLAAGSMLAVIWVITATVHVPLHKSFTDGISGDAAYRLVRSNWVRTWAWTVRGLLALAIVVQFVS